MDRFELDTPEVKRPKRFLRRLSMLAAAVSLFGATYAGSVAKNKGDELTALDNLSKKVAASADVKGGININNGNTGTLLNRFIEVDVGFPSEFLDNGKMVELNDQLKTQYSQGIEDKISELINLKQYILTLQQSIPFEEMDSHQQLLLQALPSIEESIGYFHSLKLPLLAFFDARKVYIQKTNQSVQANIDYSNGGRVSSMDLSLLNIEVEDAAHKANDKWDRVKVVLESLQRNLDMWLYIITVWDDQTQVQAFKELNQKSMSSLQNSINSLNNFSQFFGILAGLEMMLLSLPNKKESGRRRKSWSDAHKRDNSENSKVKVLNTETSILEEEPLKIEEQNTGKAISANEQ